MPMINIEKPSTKPIAIVAANHNSHLDTLVLMSLFPLSLVHKVRPVAAEDYFLKYRIVAWFTVNVLGIVPIQRNAYEHGKDIFKDCHKALDKNDILLIFPEGSRGRPEKMGAIKKGLYFLTKERKDTAITPVAMHGMGRTLPRGDALFVPFNCDVIIGPRLPSVDNPMIFVEKLTEVYSELFHFCLTRVTNYSQANTVKNLDTIFSDECLGHKSHV